MLSLLAQHVTLLSQTQDSASPTDSLSLIATDTLATTKNKGSSGSAPFLDAEVKYSCNDSLSFDFETKKMYLFGSSKIEYGEISLTAHAIELDMDSTIAYAYGLKDSLGVESDLPVFKDKSGEYEMREMRYNFKTKKAVITHIVTEQGEGFVVGQKAKRVDEETYFMRDAKYTTCQNHDNPHFYLNLTKAKVIPGKRTVTGPAYLVLQDVPMPIGIPFAIIPNTKSYSSGIIIPTYGDESSRGFYLRNGGYYWAANDYFDLRMTADIYTKGSWGAHLSSTYKKRYKFSGSFSADYIVNVTSEKGLPDYNQTRDFSLRWSHSQDSKANPDRTFSASVNYSTSAYNKNNVGNLVNPEVLATNQKSSSISYSRKWPNFPFRLTAALTHSQNSRDESISLSIPDINITSSKRFYPFKGKGVATKSNPLRDINLNYTMSMKNRISCKEKELTFAPEDLLTKWKNGIKHTIPIQTNVKLGRFISMTPSFSYNERWYFSKTRQHWDEENQVLVKEDPEAGFNRSYDYSFSTGFSTKVYMFWKPIRALFGDRVNAIRHVMTPSVSFSYVPDFSERKFGSYDSFEYYDKKSDKIVKYKYSYFNGYEYGTPGSNESGKISLSLSNTLEMKVKSDTDTTGYKKIPLLESLSLSSGYDLMKDSMNWDIISMSGRTKLFGTNVNFNASLDQYGLVASPTGSPIRINKSSLRQNHRLVRLQSASLSFGLQFSPETIKKLREGKNTTDDENEEDEDWALKAAESDELEAGAQMPKNSQDEDTRLSEGDEGYAAFDMPWTISLNFSLRLQQDKFNPKTCLYSHKITSTVNINGSLSLTPKWKVSISSGYSFDEKKLSQTSIGITRDLHCWSMNFNLVPTGAYKSYNFNIAINSSMLKDLKYQQSNSPRDNGRFR
ncbi:MAG: LPS-assembly protein LptD [Marinilabiliaceae bacterium]|nr:LPS-assembly protein LptD [Marinilabiliaceae bacterium]